MNKHENYLDYICAHVEGILGRNLCIIKNEQLNTFYFKSVDDCSLSEKQQNVILIKEFMHRFKEYMTNDSPLHISYIGNKNLYYDFFNRLSSNLYNSDPYNYLPKPRIIPTVDELLKIGNLFKEGTSEIDYLINQLPKENNGFDIHGKRYTDFVSLLITIPNNHLFEDNHKSTVSGYTDYVNKRIINNEIAAIRSIFNFESDINIKNSIITYLKNRKPFLEKISDKQIEEHLFDWIKNSIHPNYWYEASLEFPNLHNTIKGTNSPHLFEIDNSPIFHFNLNKTIIHQICPSILNDDELKKVVQIITHAINKNKPEKINMVQFYFMTDEIKICFSGKELNKSDVLRIGKLYEQMLYQYRSDNVLKFVPFQQGQTIASHNVQYLDNVSQVLWLELLLEKKTNDTQKIIRKRKI